MNLRQSIRLYGGGPGSGCNPEAGQCGRKPGSGNAQHVPEAVLRRIADYRNVFPKAMSRFASVAGKYGKIKGRVKAPESLAEKLTRYNISVETVTDVIGMSVTTRSIADVYKAVEGVKSKFTVVQLEDKIKKDQSGYRAVHLLIQYQGKTMEVQVKTENQAKWQSWEHDLLYKGPLHGMKLGWDYAKKVSEALYRADRGLKFTIPKCPPPLVHMRFCFE